MIKKSSTLIFAAGIVSLLALGGWLLRAQEDGVESGVLSGNVAQEENNGGGNADQPAADPALAQSQPEQTTPEYTELVFVEDAHNHQVIALSLDGGIAARIPVGKEPHDIAVSPDQRYVVTANQGDGTASVIETATLTLARTIPTGKGAHGVAFSPDGQFLFVANSLEDTLSIIDTATFARQEKVKVAGTPEYVGVTKDGSHVFTTNLGGDGSITILRNQGFASSVVKTSYSGIDPHGWALAPDGRAVVITNLGSNFTYLLDSETFENIGRINTGATTEFAAFKNNAELWVTNISSRYLSIVDVENNEVIGTMTVGETPHGISFSQDRSRAFVPLYGPGEVAIIDAAARTIIKKVPVGQELHNAAVARVQRR